jgi:hypothetical protein
MRRRRFLAATAALASRAAMAAPSSAATAAPALSFGLITDPQYADAEASGERHYRATPEKLERAVEFLASRQLPFTLQLGDFIDHDFRSFAALLPILGRLGHPVRHLLGNHDFHVADTEKCRVAPLLGMPHDYYTFTHSGIRFAMLDTNDVSIYKYPPGPRTDAAKKELARLKRAKRPCANPWNGAVSPTQLAWLRRTLDAATAERQRVIVCGHHPILPASPHLLWNHQALLDLLLSRPCVGAYLCGHNHNGAYAERDGLHCITFRSMLHRPGKNAFSVVRLHPDRLVVEAHGRETPRDLPLRPLAGPGQAGGLQTG